MTVGDSRVAIGQLLFLLFFSITGFTVSLVVEVVEEVIEENGIRKCEHDGPAGVAAVVKEELRRMQKGYAKLELWMEKHLG